MKSEKNIFIAFLLNLLFAIIELVGGFVTNSISIISDSVHDFGDALSIGMAYFLEKKSNKKPDKNYTYGYLRYSMLSALLTSTILLVGAVFVIVGAIPRLINPVEVNHDGMLILAILGVVINLIAAAKTSHSHNLNEKAINLHLIEDVLGWVAVLAGSIVIKFTGLYIIDPILSIGITIYILYHVYKNIKEVFNVLLEKAPSDVDLEKLKEELNNIEKVKDVHHIHIWTMDNIHHYITLHAMVEKEVDLEQVKHEIRETLEKYNLTHSTIEIEYNKCEHGECEIKHVEHEHCHHHHHHH